MSQRIPLRALMALLLTSLSADLVVAQNYERYKPLNPIRDGQDLSRVPEQELPPENQDDRVLIDNLEAVLLLDHADKVSVDPSISELTGIQYDFAARDSLLYRPVMKQVIRRYLNQPLSLRSLNQLAREIASTYKRCNQPIVDVQIPEQQISGGTLQLVVIESRIGKAIISPGCHFGHEDLDPWITSKCSGRRIYESQLSDDLFWLNQSPFRRVTVDFQPGAAEGTTDLLFKTSDVRPIRAYFGGDDTGVSTLNYGRLFAGLVYGDLFGRGDTLSYQYTTDEDFSQLHAHSLSYNRLMNRDYSFNAYGSYARVNPLLGGGLNQEGESWQAGLGLTRHFVRNYDRQQNMTLGLDFKSTNNNLEFAGTNVSASDALLVQLRLGYADLKRKSADEYELLRADVFVGPGGGLTGAHSAAAFQTIRQGTSPDYVYARIVAEEMSNVGCDWTLVSRLTGQVASERLLFSETLGLGGFDTLRGFDQRAYNGDSGWMANFEFGPRTKRWGCQDNMKSLRMYAFMDVGNGYVRHALPTEDAYTFAASTGVGFRFNISDRLSARFDWGYGFENISSGQRNNRAHIGLTWIPGPRP